MNQHLQSLLNFFEQDNTLSAEDKNAIIKSLKDANKELEITAFKLDRTEKVKRTTAILLEETIVELEQKRKAVEAQNRELEIESSLERVRTQAMSMNKPDDMLDVCRTISGQLELLNVKDIRNVQTAIIYESKGTYLNYEYYVKHDKLLTTEVEFKNHRIQEKFANQMLKGAEELFTINIKGKELPEWYAYQKTTNQFADSYLETASSLNYYWYSLGPVALGMSTYTPLNEDEISLFKRFRNVFELAYRRFIDIEKAIAQTKEAQIETSLERVRAQAMAMRTPEDLTGICEVLYAELHTLGFTEARNAMINIYDDEKRTFVNYDYSDEIGKSVNHLHYNIHPVIEKQIKQLRSAGEPFSETYFKGKDLEDMKAFRKSIGEPDDPRIDKTEALYYYFYSIGTGAIGISTFSIVTGEKLDLLKRFRNVFNLAYQRYADIAQAETQAREAQIELGLERVRARAMAMQNSDELAELVATVFKELTQLDFVLTSCIIWINNPESSTNTLWVTSSEMNQPARPIFLKPFQHSFFKSIIHAWKENDPKWIYVLSNEEKSNFEGSFFHDVPDLPDALRSALAVPEKVVFSASFNNFGAVEVIGTEPLSDEKFNILHRFGKVFDASYTRFNDLKKAEAQSREAQVELALERVRARTMAMQKSEELSETAFILYQQFRELGEIPIQITIGIIDEAERSIEFRITGSDGTGTHVNRAFNAGIEEPTLIQKLFKAWKAQQRSVVIELAGKELMGWVNYRNSISGTTDDTDYTNASRVVSAGFFSKGLISISTLTALPDETIQLLERFAAVFDQTYTRFLDLQKAEAQAREAQIEAALERVRSRSMGMQKSEELKEVIKIVYQQLRHLQINLEHAGFVIDYIPGGDWHFWIADEQDIPSKISHPYFESVWANQFNEAKEKAADFFTTHLNFEEKNKFYRELLSYIPGLPEASKDFYLNCPGLAASTVLYDNVGLYIENFLGIPYSDEENKILVRFGKVFQQTYTRFIDLQKAEAQAREAQIEAALERTRTQSMMMQHSKELDNTLRVFHQQVLLLGINSAFSFLWLPDEEKDEHKFWAAWAENNTSDFNSKAINYPLDKNEPATAQCLIDWKSNEPVYSYHVPPTGVENYFAIWSELIAGVEQLKPEYFSLGLYYVEAFMKYGCFGVMVATDLREDEKKLLNRFAIEFERTYTRFLDLQKAEALALQAESDLLKLKEEKNRTEQALVELKAAQAQLIQSEKMASLGELTAGIAHEIQNPLNFVNNFSEVSNELIDEMNAEIEKGDMEEAKAIANDIKQNLEKINHHGKRADAIVKGMLQHSRSSNATKEPTDINKLADEYLRLAYHGLRAKDKSFNAILKTDFDESLEKVNVISQDIGRVILNLITNAFYVVDEKKKQNPVDYEPTVTVSTRRSPLPGRGVGGEVSISVKDNGNGIPQKVLDKIFQPFFTTKPTGQGTGLGLSLSYDIVKAHGGEITVDSKENIGTEFKINLPI